VQSVHIGDILRSCVYYWRKAEGNLFIACHRFACARLFRLGYHAHTLSEFQHEELQVASAKAKKHPVFHDSKSEDGAYQFGKDFVAFCSAEGISLDSRLIYQPSGMSREKSSDIRQVGQLVD
jgi:hypothetical protein